MADDDKRTAEEQQRQAYEAQYKPLAADAEEKRLAQAEEDRKKREEGDEDRRKQARETPLVADAAGNVMIEAIMGPYRGNRLTVTEAEGQAAINDHWARNPVITEYQHEELSEEDRTAAWEAANNWAKRNLGGGRGRRRRERNAGSNGASASRRNRNRTTPSASGNAKSRRKCNRTRPPATRRGGGANPEPKRR